MFTKVMGFGDMYAIFALLLAPIFPATLILSGAGWLIVKGGIFTMMGNVISGLDMIFGIYMLFLAFGISSTIITVIAVIYLGQKTLLSML